MPELIQRSFVSGEIAPALRSRADMNIYNSGLALCENFIVRPQGGVYSRPGTRYIDNASVSDGTSRLIPFSFNTDQTYVLLFEHNKIRILKDGAYVLSGGVPYEVTTTYTGAQLERIRYTQDADTMVIVHPNHNPAVLQRLADDNWVLGSINFANTVDTPTPFTTVSINALSAAAGTPIVITVADTTPLADGFWVRTTGVTESCGTPPCTGTSWVDYLEDKVWEIANVTSTTFELVGSDITTDLTLDTLNIGFSPFELIGNGAGTYEKPYRYAITSVVDGVESLPYYTGDVITNSLSTTAGIHIRWGVPAAGPTPDYYRVYKNTDGSGLYGWIGDSLVSYFDDYNLAPITSDAPPSERNPFSGTSDKPSVVTYYQQRQVYANTLNEPQTVFMSQTAIYDSMRVSNPLRDDDAITFTIKSNQVNEIRHIIPLDSLIILTSGGEWKVTDGIDRVLTPSTLGIRKQTYNGASWTQPAIINNTAVYVQEKGNRIRDLAYDFSTDSYNGNDLSIMAEHLFEGYTITDMVWAAEPYGILWCLRDDGKLLGLTYQKEHKVFAWHQHDFGGTVESITAITEDGRDAVYLTVNRGGQTMIERMEARDVTTNLAMCVDSGLTYSGSPATVISGLDHLEGLQVMVVADGIEVTGLTVSSGSITLPTAASNVVVGLPFTATIDTLDIDMPAVKDTIKPSDVSVNRVIIEMYASRGGWVTPKKDDGTLGTANELKSRYVIDGYDAQPLRTDKFEFVIDPQWAKTGAVRIEQRAPFPMTILSVTPRFDVGR